MKRILSVILLAVMILSILPLSACGEADMEFVKVSEIDAVDNEDIKAAINALSCLSDLDREGYICVLTDVASGSVTIPETYHNSDIICITACAGAGGSVTEFRCDNMHGVCENLFNSEKSSGSLESILINGSFINCFNNCPVLSEIKHYMINVISGSFCGCQSLGRIDFGYDLIEDSFLDCPLRDISIYGIGDDSEHGVVRGSFLNCHTLETLEFEGDTSLIEDSFNNCASVEELSLYADNLACISRSFCEFSGTQTLYVRGTESTEQEGLTISDSFNSCPDLNKIEIENQNMKTINNSFDECPSITEIQIDIAESLSGSFNGCKRINALFLPSELSCAEDSFNDCGLDHLNKINVKSAEINGSFNRFDGLSAVTLDASVIEDSFNDCTELQAVTFEHTPGSKKNSFKNAKVTEKDFIDVEEIDRKLAEEAQEAERKRLEEEEKQRRKELKEKYKDEKYGPGTSYLRLSASENRYACYRLLRMDEDEEFMVLLKPGESVTKSFPCGRYTLKTASGEKWISDEEAFGPDGDYSTTDVFTFEADSTYYITSSMTHGDFRDEGQSGFLG